MKSRLKQWLVQRCDNSITTMDQRADRLLDMAAEHYLDPNPDVLYVVLLTLDVTLRLRALVQRVRDHLV